MRTFRLIRLAMIAILISMNFAACSDDDESGTTEPEMSTITIDSSIITNGLAFATESGEKTISFTTNTDWTLNVAATTGGSTWCTPSVTSGSKGSATVKFTTTENADYDDRSVAVTIKAGTASKTFTITQKCKDAMLLTSDKFEVSQKGGSINVEVKANVNYQMEISETAKGWITQASTRALTTHKHTFNIAANEEYDKREGEIYFITGDQKEVVKVYQTGSTVIMLTKNEYAVSDKGETITVEIKSNFEYGVKMPKVDWISDVSTRGTSSHTLKYVVSTNETYDSRSAQIIYYDKNNTSVADTLTITQAQKDAIIISKKEYSADVNGETIQVELASNTNYTVSIANDVKGWISQVESKLTRALANSKLYFKIAANSSTKKRTGIITVSDGKGISETFTVTQEKPLFEITSDKKIDVEAKSGIIEVKLKANVDFDIEVPQADWIKRVSDTRNLTEYIVKFTISENAGNDSRSAEIVFTDKNKQLKETVMVTQQASMATVTVKTAGTLRLLLGEQYMNIASLKVIGPLNGDDISIIRTMGSRNRGYDSGKLSYLDLSDASIVEGGDYYHDSRSYYTSNNIIGSYMFCECEKLNTIILPNSVTSIGDDAFSNCTGLTSVTIPNSVTTIGNSAFSSCKGLTSVTIGNSVTSIGNWAFSSCIGLTSVTIGNSVTTIGNSAFSSCIGLTSVTIGNSVTTIGNSAFYNCTGLTSITIPNSVTSIGNSAFSSCKGLTSVTIPNSVTSIGGDAFDGCTGLKEVHISDLKAWCNIVFGSYYTSTNPLYYAHHLFLNGKEITELVIPDGVASIGGGAFRLCKGLTSVTIPNSVTSIEARAFSDCTGLTSVTIPNSVTSIGTSAFNDCTGLTNVTIGKGVKAIQPYAFDDCKIKDCHIYATTPPTGGFGIGTVYAESTLYVPKGCVEVYKKANWGISFYNIVEME